MGFVTVKRASVSALSATWPQTILTDKQSQGEPASENQRYANGESWDVGDLASASPFVGQIQLAASAGLVAQSSSQTAATFIHKFGGMVCIWHDDDIQPKPSWLSDWNEIGYKVLRNNKPLSSYVKSFRPGETVTLLGNNGTSANTMYIPQVITTYQRPLPIPGSGTISLVTSAGTVDEEVNIQILVQRTGGTQGIASAPVTLGSGSTLADLKTASVSWQDGEGGNKVISVSAGTVSQNEVVRVIVSASATQTFDLNVLNVGQVVSGDTYIIDFNAVTSGTGTTASPFNTWAHLNAAVSPTDGNLIYRTKGTAEGLVMSPPRGTSANAQVIIQCSATTVLQGVIGSPLNYGISLQSADFVQILASAGAPLILDGEVATADRIAAAPSVDSGALDGGYRFIMEIRNSHDVKIRHLKTRDTWGWTGTIITGNSTDMVEFTSCEFGYHGIPGRRSPLIGDFGDTIVVSIGSAGNVLFRYCFHRAGGHNSVSWDTGQVIMYRCVLDGDYSHLGGDKGSRLGNFRRRLHHSFMDQCIIRHNGSTEDSKTSLFKLEGEDNVMRMSLFQVATETIAIKADLGDWSKQQKNNRIVHNSFHNITDGMVALRYFSVSANDDFGLMEVVNNAMNANGTASPRIDGDIYMLQTTVKQGRDWDDNLIIRGNMFSANADIVVIGGPGTQTLGYYESNHPTFAHDNIERVGIYVSPAETSAETWAEAWSSASASFTLSSSFPAGVPLTSAQATTNADNVRVADARYWRGTRGFSGLPDPFFAQGQAVNVLSVNYAQNKLIFDQNVTLTSGANCYYFSSSDPRGVPWSEIT